PIDRRKQTSARCRRTSRNKDVTAIVTAGAVNLAAEKDLAAGFAKPEFPMNLRVAAAQMPPEGETIDRHICDAMTKIEQRENGMNLRRERIKGKENPARSRGVI
ncbi:MAG: hypothetical protein ACREBV_06335, partial [Candidatus Zixiibacteriota bacterium]